MSYKLSDIKKVRDEIERLRPDFVFGESDYGFGLGVGNPKTDKGIILFRPLRHERGDTYEIKTDFSKIPAVIEALDSQ